MSERVSDHARKRNNRAAEVSATGIRVYVCIFVRVGEKSIDVVPQLIANWL